jgi:PAS domain S-box-containing protein
MKEILPDVPLVGFYSFGEYGTTIDGVGRYNNGVITALLLGRDLSYAARVAEENRRLRTELDTNITELIQTKEDLSRAEEFLRAIVDNLPIAVFAKSAEDGRLILWNKASEALHAHSTEEAVGKTDYDLFPKEQADFFWMKDREMLDSGVAMDAPEQSVFTRNRGTRILHVRVVPLYGKHSQPHALLGIAEDITERKRAEEVLQKRVVALTQPLDDPSLIQISDLFEMEDIQRIQDAFAEATGVASLITTPDGTPITQPSNFCRLCEIIRQTEQGLKNCFQSDASIGRYNPSGPIVQTCLSGGLWDAGASITVGGKHIANWLIGQVRNEELDENRMLEYAHEIGADPEEFAKALAECPDMSKEQFEKVARALFCFANELSIKAYQNVQQARFIADRQKAEALRMRLVTAIEQAAEGVMITDASGTIHYVNPALEKMTGYSSKELVGETPRVLKSGEHDEAFYQKLWDTVTRGEVWTGRLVNKKKDGRFYHEDATISPVRDASGTIVNFVGVKRDITEHLELSKQLQEAQKMEAVGTLAGGIAHDFNNLLQAVLGYSELILAEEDLPEHFRNDLEKILLAGKSGADLVKRLLTFSRKTETNPRHLDLNQSIRQTQKFLQRTIPKIIDIELRLSEGLAPIHADSTQMDQVIMNLAVNARDAMPEGGKLLIETANVVLDDDYARSHLEAKPGSYVLLRVTDTGSGMDKETLKHIFEPFYTTKGPGKGTGLGLAMVFGIVKQHHGFIKCSSEVGRGATFEIYLPALTSILQLDQLAVSATPPTGTETILLVDDEELLLDLGKRILSKAGYTVLTAHNGKGALDLYRSDKGTISLVILDLIMPEMDGKQCLKELLKLDPGTRVLVASGYAADGPTMEALEEGAKGFVPKPFDIGQLLQTVRDALDAE